MVWKALTKEAIGYENGVLGCVSSAAQAFSAPGEAVLLHSPTHIGFTHALESIGRKIILSDLVRDEEGIWRMDYEDMDRKLKENHIHFAVFCSPPQSLRTCLDAGGNRKGNGGLFQK